jgi:hypothetical protein
MVTIFIKKKLSFKKSSILEKVASRSSTITLLSYQNIWDHIPKIVVFKKTPSEYGETYPNNVTSLVCYKAGYKRQL